MMSQSAPSTFEARILAVLGRATRDDIEVYKRYLNMPTYIADTEFFSWEQRFDWVNTRKYGEFIAHRLAQSGTSNGGSTTAASAPVVPASVITVPLPSTSIVTSPAPAIAPASSTGSESEPQGHKRGRSLNTVDASPSKVTKKARVGIAPQVDDSDDEADVREVIEILDSDEEAQFGIQSRSVQQVVRAATAARDFKAVPITGPSPVKSEVKPEVKSEAASSASPAPAESGGLTIVKTIDNRVKVTKKYTVKDVQVLNNVPRRWPASPDTAFVIDMASRGEPSASTITQKPKGLDRILKEEDQDSWGQGTNGSTKHEVGLILLDNIPARRSVHKCNGSLECANFDRSLIPEDYSRVDTEDLGVSQAVFVANTEQNKAEADSIVAATAQFHFVALMLKCAKELACGGTPIMKCLSKGPSPNGKVHFIGCSAWRKSEEFRHLYAPIPAIVDEVLLQCFMNGQAAPQEFRDAVARFEKSCATLIHPRHGKQDICHHVHFKNAKPVQVPLVQRPCPVKKIVYTSKSASVRKVIVIFDGLHNHPPWPEEKPTPQAMLDLKQCLKVNNIIGVSPGQIDNAPATIALFRQALSQKHSAFRNRRVLSDKVKKHKLEHAPKGLDWDGVLDLYEKDRALPIEKRYIWRIVCVMTNEGDLRVVVTGLAFLLGLIHTVSYFVADFTFKRVHGNTNEWEVAIWRSETNERVTIARVYCNMQDKAAFSYVWSGFFGAIQEATGRRVAFKVFDAKKGNILVVLMDMEAAQVQALAETLIAQGNHTPEISQTSEQDPDILVQYVLKLCSVHWDRGTDKLVGDVGREVVEYLNSFRGLSSLEDIRQWHVFCAQHPSKKLRDWYEHKKMYPWLLPGFNRSLTRMPNEHWDRTPSHTNLVETAHVASTKATGIGLTFVEAIQSARRNDERVAEEIQAASTSLILRNPHNGLGNRMKKSVTRGTHARTRHAAHENVDDKISNVRGQLSEMTTDYQTSAKALRTELKDLTSRKKELGRSPKHSGAHSKASDIAAIPIRFQVADQVVDPPHRVIHQEQHPVAAASDLPDVPGLMTMPSFISPDSSAYCMYDTQEYDWFVSGELDQIQSSMSTLNALPPPPVSQPRAQPVEYRNGPGQGMFDELAAEMRQPLLDMLQEGIYREDPVDTWLKHHNASMY